jgi:NDP-sugar pyrophosphorylase family protein
MKAMLLSAGLGRRMFPLTLTQPKPAIPVLGRPLVVQILRSLEAQGVNQAVLNLHHLPEVIQEILSDGKWPGLPEVLYSHEEEILGTAGGIRNASEMLRGGGPIVICNSDFLSDIDLDAVLEAHYRSGRMATLVLAPWQEGYSVVRCDENGAIRWLGHGAGDETGPGGTYLFTGCHIVEEELLDRIPEEAPSCIVRDVYHPMIDERLVGSYIHEGFWWEFGSPEQYLDGCLQLLAHPGEQLNAISTDHDTIRRLDQANAAVGPGADFHESARFTGRAALGFSTYVSEQTTVEDSIVMPEAWIGPRCNLKRSVVCQGVELPAGFESSGELICQDSFPAMDLPPSTRREGGLLRHRLQPVGSG